MTKLGLIYINTLTNLLDLEQIPNIKLEYLNWLLERINYVNNKELVSRNLKKNVEMKIYRTP